MLFGFFNGVGGFVASDGVRCSFIACSGGGLHVGNRCYRRLNSRVGRRSVFFFAFLCKFFHGLVLAALLCAGEFFACHDLVDFFAVQNFKFKQRFGKVSGGTESASERTSGADSEVTPDTASSGSESRSGASESNPMPIIAGVAIAAGVGVGGYFMMKKKK